MKKTNQNDLELEMINLDETAGWNQLEIESALAEDKAEENMVFQGEITISEEELLNLGMSVDVMKEVTYFDDEDVMESQADMVHAEETVTEAAEYPSETVLFEKGEMEENEYIEDDEILSADEYVDEDVFDAAEYIEETAVIAPKKKTSKSGKGKKAKKKKKQTPWDKIVAAFHEMTVLDGVIATTGALVLVVAIVTVSVFSSAKTAEAQVASFAPIGEDIAYLADAGKGTLLAMADADRWMEAVEEEETETVDFEYEEKELEESATINVNMKLTSVQKDLKIKFVNYKTGKLISSVPFEVSVTDSANTTKNYKDDDMDGIIYLKEVTPGKATVTMMALSGEEGLAFNTAPQTINIKDQIEYTKIDVEEEVKTESEVNAAVEDTAQENVVEAELTDTVEWVASTKTEVDSETSYEKVDKKTIANPLDSAKAFVRMTADVNPATTEESTVAETKTTEETSSSTTESTSSGDDSSEEENESSSGSTEGSSGSTEESSDSTEGSSGSTEENSGSTEESSGSTEESSSSTEESSGSETSSPESSEEESSSESKEDKVKNDTVSLLKDKSGNQMYLKNSDGKYVEAKYADYYNDKVTFYKKVKSSKYKYTGWQDIDGKTYFFTKDGDKVTGEQVIQGAKYNFDSDGVLQTGSGTLGIDVSKWNGNIDWAAVKKSGVSYVIIRCGYRGSTTGAMIEDPKFKSNIQGAANAGLKVGIYFFSQAVNEVEAVEEASMTISLIKKYKISYPVFLDVEASGGRADGIDRNTRTKVIKAYCETIRNSGYTAGVYANKTWLESYMNAGELSKYKIWLAQYNTAPTYGGKYDLWQYSSKGSVSGISGHTDMNLSYLGY